MDIKERFLETLRIHKGQVKPTKKIVFKYRKPKELACLFGIHL